jgi:hypothetical protein
VATVAKARPVSKPGKGIVDEYFLDMTLDVDLTEFLNSTGRIAGRSS